MKPTKNMILIWQIFQSNLFDKTLYQVTSRSIELHKLPVLPFKLLFYLDSDINFERNVDFKVKIGSFMN